MSVTVESILAEIFNWILCLERVTCQIVLRLDCIRMLAFSSSLISISLFSTEQLLITGDGKHVKLADFGLARLSAIPNGPYTFEVVTLWYRAPELLLGANRYSTSVDVWSIGCIFAEMASGMPLFPGRSDIDQLFKIFQRRGTPTAEMWPAVLRLPHYNAEFPQWRERSITDFVPLQGLGGTTGADLLQKLLLYDPDRRIACKTALQHPYFMQQD